MMLWLMFGCTFALALAGPPPLATNCIVEGQTCGIGQNNLLTSYAGVESLHECEALCINNYDCKFITHFGPDSFPLRNYCMLFSDCGNVADCQDCTTAEIHGPLKYCQHCSSSFPDCRNITGGICTFFVGDEVTALTSYKFTETGITTVNIVPLGDMDCELTVVAVGGGGIYSGWYGGGGSGYVASTSVMPSPLSQLVVRVGGPGELSSLETSEGETIITAQPGEKSDHKDGGAGYSGGGGGSFYGGGDGGEDGGDGDNSHPHGDTNGHLGGRGSGQDISTTIHLQQFSLTPGRGGQRNGRYGGGGGGIMVDGSGPQDTVYNGQGYGGGQGIHGGNPGPGLVLLEIKPKQ